tara:strand:+ start:2258 stop:3670 length:1413 start_codon:yes stop_codon:yes gene_type:complete
MKKLSQAKAQQVMGIAGDNTKSGQIRADEFLPELKGQRAIKTYRQMRDNDATIGAVMYAVEQILRDVEMKVKPADDSQQAKDEAFFVESVLNDMDETLDDHVAEALSYLSYGFAWFEVIYKRRVGPTERSPKKHSKYTDGRLGVRKIAARAPWTINKFNVEPVTGDVLGIEQSVGFINGKHYIPTNKSLYYRTTTLNGDASGRSILRNAYTSYTYLNNVQSIEAIAIERELAGIPVARIPAEYLSGEASAGQSQFVGNLQQILRDVKFNEQGYIILPSDTYPDKDGSPTNHRLVDIELMSASGKRNIDINPVVTRYQHDIARSVLSEFLLLGTSGGSYALSKSKTDLFLRALESYIQAIVDVLNKQLVERLWQLNGLDYKYMPTIEAGDVAPHDLREVSSFLRNLNGAGIDVSQHPEVISDLMDIAELDYDADLVVPEPEEPEVVVDEPTSTQKLEEEILEETLKVLKGS